MRFGVALIPLASLGCAVSTQSESASSASALECSAAAKLNGDGTATMSGCPFEQHMINIANNGVAIAGPEFVKDSTGNVLATASQSCAQYVLAKDERGVTIIIDLATGKVESHGMYHAGFTTSSFTQLPAPVVLMPAH